MSKPWSKLKAPIERLWADGLHMAIHCTAYSNSRERRDSRLSRHWIVLNKAVLWDFPGQFLAEAPARGRQAPEATPQFPNGGSTIAPLLRDYLDRPVEHLLDPFVDDDWELTDILRAADRRLGKARLLDWGLSLDADHPAHKVLSARFGPDN